MSDPQRFSEFSGGHLRFGVSIGLAALLGAALLGGACSGEDASADGSGGDGGASWSASSVVTGAGGGSVTGSSDATVTSSGQGGASTSVTSASGGGMPTGRALLLAGGAQLLVGASFDGATWETTTLPGATDRGLSLAFVTKTLAVGVHRDPAVGALTFETYDATWAAPAPVGPNVTTQNAPALTARGAAAEVVFHGDDFKFYFASYSGTWSPTSEPVKPSMQDQSFGQAPGALAASGEELIFAFAGSDGALYEQSHTSSGWQPASQHAGTSVTGTPALVALASGPELLLVYLSAADKKLMFATRSAGTWTAPAVLESNSFSAEPPALVALPTGEAITVFRGLDGKPYVARFQLGMNPPWTAPKPLAMANPDVTHTPSIAVGVDGHEAELAYVATDGNAYHTSLDGGAWSAAAFIAGPGLSHVAIATPP